MDSKMKHFKRGKTNQKKPLHCNPSLCLECSPGPGLQFYLLNCYYLYYTSYFMQASLPKPPVAEVLMYTVRVS